VQDNLFSGGTYSLYIRGDAPHTEPPRADFVIVQQNHER
jgi:hypothetical protein